MLCDITAQPLILWNCTGLRPTKATELYISENPLEKVQNYKYLCMWMDVNLDWHYCID